MTRSDLRSLFRSNQQDLRAEDVFADRMDEWNAVARSLAAHAVAVRQPGFDVADFESPRRNVLVFYGVGGIGKSTFSRHLEEHLLSDGPGIDQWTPVPEQVGRLLPVRIDLSRQSGLGFEDILLALRLAAGRLGSPMPAFDLALRRYWDVNHPGEPLEAYLRRHGFLRRFATAMSLPEQVQSVLGDVAQAVALPGTLGALVGQSLRSVIGSLREHRKNMAALAGCARLADLLEADADLDALSYYAHLLAWDLAQLPADRSGTLVVLLDTFEDVGDRTHRELERLIQRVAWLMPNVLFVVTGRNRLQWDDERLDGQLDWTGPSAWPHLAPGATAEPRQHRVGYLSAEDCERYLCRRLTRHGQPLMAAGTRHEIVRRSHGLPLYLDLAVMRYLDLFQRTGRQPAAGEFQYDFPALVARTFRDLSGAERQVLRTVSLFDSFSVDLATAASGLAQDSATLQLVERPFIDADPAAPWPYHLHDLIREAIREADATAEDRWSAADWHRAARRAFDALRAELPPAGEDRRRLLACLTQGLRLASSYGLELDWLVDAGYRYVSDFIWEPIDLPLGTPGSAASALATTLRAAARRQRVHRQEIVDELTAVLAGGLLPPSAQDLARYFLAECQRDLGRHEESAAGMRQVAEGAGPLAADAARGLVHLARRLGDFPAVRAAAERLPAGSRRHRTLGDLWWTQGSVSLACSAYDDACRAATAESNPGEAALSRACLAFAAAFQDTGRADQQLQLAEGLLEGASIRWAEIQAGIAGLLRDAGADPALPARAAGIEADAEASGLTSSVAYARLAVCFHHAVLADQPGLAAARTRLRGCVNGAEFAYLLEISHFFDGSEPPPDLPRAAWLDGTQATAARWSTLLADRRAAVSASG
ncbi:ATP/GTP-binding protein [Streptomyces sp. NPDC021020]|uniref:ATP/GTP-binding protein n=1 Tax=Streptomyces sp. NPDC021020 TaxID=3365109 RepID=UPI003794CB7F